MPLKMLAQNPLNDLVGLYVRAIIQLNLPTSVYSRNTIVCITFNNIR